MVLITKPSYPFSITLNYIVKFGYTSIERANIVECFALRCLSFPDMEPGGQVDFDVEKELCGGKVITEEQR